MTTAPTPTLPSDWRDDHWLAVVNPAAGGGRAGPKVEAALRRLRDGGLRVLAWPTSGPGHATALARAGWEQGARRFLAVGGDGTTFELINGLFPAARASGERPRLGLLPMGTGNSFLRDFTREGAEATIPALLEGRRRGCDVVRVEHDAGVFHYLNILCVGWVADVNALRGRRFARFGELGYVFAVLSELAGLHAGTYPLREAGGAWERAPQTFISINNSRFTGGAMMMAPAADTADGKVDVVRVGAMGRIALLRAFPRIFKGTHVDLPVVRASQTAAVEFDLPEPVDVMVDGEALTARLTRLEVLPAAVDLVI